MTLVKDRAEVPLRVDVLYMATHLVFVSEVRFKVTKVKGVGDKEN